MNTLKKVLRGKRHKSLLILPRSYVYLKNNLNNEMILIKIRNPPKVSVQPYNCLIVGCSFLFEIIFVLSNFSRHSNMRYKSEIFDLKVFFVSRRSCAIKRSKLNSSINKKTVTQHLISIVSKIFDNAFLFQQSDSGTYRLAFCCSSLRQLRSHSIYHFSYYNKSYVRRTFESIHK